jgi:hypothetical protein
MEIGPRKELGARTTQAAAEAVPLAALENEVVYEAEVLDGEERVAKQQTPDTATKMAGCRPTLAGAVEALRTQAEQQLPLEEVVLHPPFPPVPCHWPPALAWYVSPVGRTAVAAGSKKDSPPGQAVETPFVPRAGMGKRKQVGSPFRSPPLRQRADLHRRVRTEQGSMVGVDFDQTEVVGDSSVLSHLCFKYLLCLVLGRDFREDPAVPVVDEEKRHPQRLPAS